MYKKHVYMRPTTLTYGTLLMCSLLGHNWESPSNLLDLYWEELKTSNKNFLKGLI